MIVLSPHMMNVRVLFVLAIVVSTSHDSFSQTIWDGPYQTFAKENGADWNLEENQDRITDDVWITRRNSQGIFNISTENFYLTNVSPEGTEWAFGNTDEIASLTFSDWRTAIGANPPGMIDLEMVVHLIETDIYIDIFFVSWQQNSGGGFSYKRKSPTIVGIGEPSKSETVIVFPNPTSRELRLENHLGLLDYIILDHSGRIVQKGQWNTEKSLDITSLPSGIYAIKTKDWSVKWVKID